MRTVKGWIIGSFVASYIGLRPWVATKAPAQSSSLCAYLVSVRWRYLARIGFRRGHFGACSNGNRGRNVWCVHCLRRFPPLWTLEPIPGGFKVLDAEGLLRMSN